MNLRYIFALSALVSLLSGCTSLHGTKADERVGKNICVIDNHFVKPAFRDAYLRRLAAKGYEARVVPKGATCNTTSTYDADYGFSGWGPYLSQAELIIYSKGVEIGKSVYRAPSAAIGKEGRVEGKIEAMVDQLLP